MQPDDIITSSKKFSRRSQRKKRRSYDSMNLNIKRLSQEYETIETLSSMKETIVTDVTEKKRKRHLTSKRSARRNTVPNEQTTIGDLKKITLGGLGAHFVEAVINLEQSLPSNCSASPRQKSLKRVHFDDSKEESAKDLITQREQFLDRYEDGTLDTLRCSEFRQFTGFMKQLRRRSDSSKKSNKKINNDQNKIEFNYTGIYENRGRRYSSVVNAIEKKKRKVSYVLKKLLLALHEPIQLFLDVIFQEGQLELTSKMELDKGEISEYKRNHRLDFFMQEKKVDQIYIPQMMQKINALIFLYAKNIYHHNYLRDFDIFIMCNCFQLYGGCPDNCTKNEYIRQYVQDLFVQPEYLASIRGKDIDVNVLQWD
jgi:hypothetical protein